MSKRTIQYLFKSQFDYLASTPQPLKNRKAIYAIAHCRTPDMGVSYFACKDQHEVIQQYHSCRNRSCYLCSEKTKHDWIEKQKTHLLNVPHFHVVFTLPHEYLTLWRYNESLFTQLLFRASQQTLMELLGDDKYHGITPGILMALHTWGRALPLHPHTHCLVTAGGLTAAGDWQGIDDYLLPIRVVKRLYRGKVQALLREAFAAERLVLPPDMDAWLFWQLYRTTYKKEWSVRIEKRYEHGQGVMLYLARYVKSGPIHPEQISFDGRNKLSFRYFDHRSKRVKTMRLSVPEFLSLFLQHVPALSLHTVRYYGLYAASHHSRGLPALQALGNLANERSHSGLVPRDMLLLCRTCGGRTHWIGSQWRGRVKAISINKEDRANGSVQQDAEVGFRIRGPDSTPGQSQAPPLFFRCAISA